MKIALCMSGITRTFRYTYKSFLNNIISKYDCDTFIYVSKDENSSDMDLIPSVKKVVYDKEPIIDVSGYHKYKCKRYSEYGILNQWWKIEECFKLVEQYQIDNNIKYDLVIRCRPDLLITREIDDLTKLDRSAIYVAAYPKGYFEDEKLFAKDYVHDFPTRGNWLVLGIPDQLAIGTMETMKLYSYKFSNFDAFYKRHQMLNAEVTTAWMLKEINMPVKFLRPLYRILRKSEADLLSNNGNLEETV